MTPAGDGDINWVRRARLPDGRGAGSSSRPARSWTLPRVDAAPTERIVFEARFYHAMARRWDEDGICPEIAHFDRER